MNNVSSPQENNNQDNITDDVLRISGKQLKYVMTRVEQQEKQLPHQKRDWQNQKDPFH